MFDSSFEGSIPKIWGPLFEKLIKLPIPCARGYVKLMLKLLEDDDSSLKRNDLTSFGLLFKIYRYIFEELLPFIHHKRTHDVIYQIVDENSKYLAQSPDGSIDLNKVNEFFIRWSNDLNDSLNEYMGNHWGRKILSIDQDWNSLIDFRNQIIWFAFNFCDWFFRLNFE